MADVEEPIEEPIEEPEEEVEEDYVNVGGATEVKLFGKWSFDDIEVRDISLVVRNHSQTKEKHAFNTPLHRTTLPAKGTMQPTCLTRLVDTPRSAFARPVALLSNDWSAASCATDATRERNSWLSVSFSTLWKSSTC